MVWYLRTFNPKKWGKIPEKVNIGKIRTYKPDNLPGDVLDDEEFKDFKVVNGELSLWRVTNESQIDLVVTRMAITKDGIKSKGYVLLEPQELGKNFKLKQIDDDLVGFSHKHLHWSIVDIKLNKLLKFVRIVCPKICEASILPVTNQMFDKLELNERLKRYCEQGMFSFDNLPDHVKSDLRNSD